MVGEIESEQAGGLADVVSLHQQTFRLIDYIIMYVTDSRATSGLVDDVAKVAGRIGQFGSAPSDGRQPLHQLPVLTKIGLKQVVKALQQVSLSPVLFEKLALIDTSSTLRSEGESSCVCSSCRIWVTSCVIQSHSSGSIRSEPSKKYEKN